MSGRKYTQYVTINVNELANLRRQVGQVADLVARNRILDELSSKNEDALRSYNNQINSLNRNMNNLQSELRRQETAASKEAQQLRTQLQNAIREGDRRLQAAIAQGNERLRRTEEENNRRINQVEQNFAESLSQTRSELTTEINRTRTELTEALNNNVRELRGAIEEENRRIDEINSAVQNMQDNNNTLVEMAREYYRIAGTILNEIRTNYRVELLCPGRLSPVEADYNKAGNELNLASNNPQNSSVARLEAQRAMQSVYQLYQDVIRAEQEWQLCCEATNEILNASRARLEGARTVQIGDSEGQISLDVNRWSNGDLSERERRLEALVEQMEKPQDLSLSDLQGIQEAGIQLNREVDETALFAAVAATASQDRVETAADIADELSKQGVLLVDRAYQGGDQRSSHRIHLRNNVTGFEIVITQTPVPDGSGNITNRLESDIISYGTNNMEEGERIARELLQSLTSGRPGMQVPVQTVAGFEGQVSNRPEITNITQWRQESCPDTAKPVHVNNRQNGSTGSVSKQN